jgi:predicted phage terminase large subunit-like protein
LSFNPAEFDPLSVDRERQLLDIDRVDCEQSLYEFLRSAWRYIDPAVWKDSWAVEAICEHLQAVVDGQIRRLIINCIPRIGKSNTVSVAFPAWTWAQPLSTPTSGPGVPFLYASYKDNLSLRDSVKCRRLIESPWYQDRWGDRFRLTTDQNTKARFTNDKGGERLITSIDAGTTGEGGNIICIDDPNSAGDVQSDIQLQNTIDWWTTTMPTRANDLNTCAWVIIQQRLAENDLTGHILEHEADGWTHLCLPGRYEPERSFHTSIGWKDPRTTRDELLWPERFSEESLKKLEITMGPYVFAGQIQQRPEPKGGGIIKREWWKLWDHDGYDLKHVQFVLAVLDTAYTEDELNDPSGMMIWMIYNDDVPEHATRMIEAIDQNDDQLRARSVEMAKTYSGRAPKVVLAYAWDEHLELHSLVQRVAKTCIHFKVDQLVIENKASGISVAQEIRRLYDRERFAVQLFDPKSQDKAARLYSVQHLFAEGMIYAPDRVWAEKVMKQVGQFPKGAHDEYVDLTSMGLRKLRDMGLLVRQPEREAEIEAEKAYHGRQEPLYAV